MYLVAVGNSLADSFLAKHLIQCESIAYTVIGQRLLQEPFLRQNVLCLPNTKPKSNGMFMFP